MSAKASRRGIRVLPVLELEAQHLARWRQLQAGNPDLHSPFFAPEFAQAFSRQKHPVHVALIEENGAIAGFFPFERGGLARAGPQDRALSLLGAGCPAGRRLSDSHGLISAPGFLLDAPALLAACGLTAWDFHRLPATQATFSSYRTSQQDWHVIDLRDGYQSYIASIEDKSSDILKQSAMKARRLARAAGPLSCKTDLTDPQLLKILLNWRYARYPGADQLDGLTASELETLLAHLLAIRAPNFSGKLSALYAGDQLAALHFGISSPQVLIYWFLGFNPALASHSPGIILLLRMIEQAGRDGVIQIDLGAGTERYKQQLHSRTIPLLTGSAVRPSPLALYRRVKGRIARTGQRHQTP